MIAAAPALSVLLLAVAPAGHADAGPDGPDDAGAPSAPNPDALIGESPDGGRENRDEAGPSDALVPVVLRVLLKAQGTREPVVGASLLIDGNPVGESDVDGVAYAASLPGRHRLRISCPGFETETRLVSLPSTSSRVGSLPASLEANHHGKEWKPSQGFHISRVGSLPASLEANHHGKEWKPSDISRVGSLPASLEANHHGKEWKPSQGFQISDLQVSLRPAESGERYQTVVTARPAGPSVSLAGEEAASTPGAAADPFRTLESLPGVANVFWPLPLYAVRGSNPGNTGFLLDGIKVPSLFHLALGPSVIHPLLLDRMSFYSGSYPAQYGRYAGGLVAASTGAPPTDRPHAVVDLRALDSGALVSSPFPDGRGSVALAGRYSYTGFLVSRFSSDIELGYWDYQLRADHTLGPGRIMLLAFGAADHLRRKDHPGTDANLNFHRLRLAWDGGLAGGRLLAGVALGADHTFLNFQDFMIAPLTVRSYLLAPRLEYSRPLARVLEIQTGLDADIQRFLPESDLANVDRPDISRTRTAYAWGGFVAARWQPSADWLLVPGLRIDAFAEETAIETALQPRFEVAWRARKFLWIKASAGTFAQMASMPTAVPGFEGFGLASTGIQRTRQGSLGVEAQAGTWFTGTATAFLQRGRLSDLRTVFDLEPEKGILEMRESRSYGIEFMLKRDFSHRVHGWLSYTWSRSERLLGNYGPVVPSDWDQRHILNLLANVRLPRRWTLGGRVHYNTGRPYPVLGHGEAVVDYIRLKPFLQVDIRAEKRFILDRFMLDAYVELGNVLVNEQEGRVWRQDDGTLKHESVRLALPSLGVRAWF